MISILDITGLSYFWGKITSALDTKQDILISGTNIKTVNNESLLGSGNITVSGGGSQSDWNETDSTSAAYILNKPAVISAEFSYDSTNEALVITPTSAAVYDSVNESLTIL